MLFTVVVVVVVVVVAVGLAAITIMASLSHGGLWGGSVSDTSSPSYSRDPWVGSDCPRWDQWLSPDPPAVSGAGPQPHGAPALRGAPNQ